MLADGQWELCLGDAVIGGQEHGPLHHVDQLPHIAGPLVLRQRLHGPTGDAVHIPADPAPQKLEVALRQARDILSTVLERGERQGHDPEPIVEVPAEAALADIILKVPVGGGHDAHVHRYLLLCPQAPHLAVLEHPQELDLEVRLHFGDLVEENCAAVGHLKAAAAGADRACESPSLVAEQLTLQQRLRQGAAVDGHERAVGAGALVVDGPGQALLAHARLAKDEQRDRAGCHPLDHLHEGVHHRALGDEVAQPGLNKHWPGGQQLGDLAAALLQLGCQHLYHEPGGGGGLQDKVRSSCQELGALLGVTAPGHQSHGGRVRHLLEQDDRLGNRFGDDVMVGDHQVARLPVQGPPAPSIGLHALNMDIHAA